MRKIFGNFIYIGSLSLIAGAVGYASFKCIVEITSTNNMFLKVVTEIAPWQLNLAYILILTFFLFSLIYLVCNIQSLKDRYADERYKKVFTALSPLLGLYLLIFLEHSFADMVIFTGLGSIAVFRVLLLFNNAWVLLKLDWRVSWLILLFVTGLFIWHGYHIQSIAYDKMMLSSIDWGEYLGIAYNTCKGEWFMTSSSAPKTNFLSTHFSPVSLLLISFYLKLFYSVKAFLLMNSLVLYSAGPLTYLLARVKKLPSVAALMLAFSVLLSPSLANLNLCSFNGFHPISFMIPTLLIFFILLESRRIVPALLVFLLSLMIKETVSVFWVGMGLALLASGRHRLGGGIALFSLIYYFAVMRLIIPAFAGDAVYDYVFRFAHLGDSEMAIIFSPFTRPAAFWGYLMRPQCIYFIIMLLPAFILALHRIIIIAGAGITLMFVCLQSSEQLQNINMQYQSEGVIVVYIAAVLAAGALLQSRGKIDIFRFWAWGVSSHRFLSQRSILTAALPAVVFSVFGAHFFFAQNYFINRAGAIQLLRSASSRATKALPKLKELIPPNAPLTATSHISCQFLLRNDVSTSFSELKEYVLIDLLEPYQRKDILDQTRHTLLKSDKYQLMFNHIELNRHYILFGPKEKSRTMNCKQYTGVRIMTNAQWNDLSSHSTEQLNGDFIVKCLFKGNRKDILLVAIRLTRKVDYDCNIKAEVCYENSVLRWNNCFGHGIRPAFMCEAGSVFIMPLKLPDNCTNSEIKVLLEKREDSVTARH